MTSPLRIGFAGYGYWGPNILRNLDRLAEATVVAACDANPGNRAKLQAAYPHIATSDSLDAMLAAHELDAVVVATSAPTHAELAARVLEAGLHCFVEKPLTLASADAQRLVDLAAANNRVLMVGHLMVYHAAIDWIADYIASGELGDVRYLYFQRLNLGKVRADENAFWSLAPHDVSVALHLLGETPDSVSASGADYLRNGVHDVVFANLHFPSGKMANIHVSWLDPHKVRRMTVVGSKKMLVFNDMEATDKIWIYDKGVEPADAMAYGEDLTLRFGDIRVPYLKMTEPLGTEMRHFVECCTTGATPRSSGIDGLRVVQVLEATDASLAAGGAPVKIEVGA
ncbi:MAG: Gfo/Idh/MocA family oxidoreductase [Coriobacteriia bacterium]|nr:Gfo/Idh/MocA family oxidoreductase [Coriobacteriia bacterium]